MVRTMLLLVAFASLRLHAMTCHQPALSDGPVSRGFVIRVGSTCNRIIRWSQDAMSEAVEGAEVILYGISEKYKESANVSRHAFLLCFSS